MSWYQLFEDFAWPVETMLAAGAALAVTATFSRDLVAGSGLRFENRGIHALRGLPNDMHLYTVVRAA